MGGGEGRQQSPGRLGTSVHVRMASSNPESRLTWRFSRRQKRKCDRAGCMRGSGPENQPRPPPHTHTRPSALKPLADTLQSALQRARRAEPRPRSPARVPCPHSAGPCPARPGVFQAQSGAGEGSRRGVTHPGSWQPGLCAASQPLSSAGEGRAGAGRSGKCCPTHRSVGHSSRTRAGGHPGTPTTASHPGSLTLHTVSFCPFGSKSCVTFIESHSAASCFTRSGTE